LQICVKSTGCATSTGRIADTIRTTTTIVPAGARAGNRSANATQVTRVRSDFEVEHHDPIGTADGFGHERSAGGLVGRIDEIGVAGGGIDEIEPETVTETMDHGFFGGGVGAPTKVEDAGQMCAQRRELLHQGVFGVCRHILAKVDEHYVTDHAVLLSIFPSYPENGWLRNDVRDAGTRQKKRAARTRFFLVVSNVDQAWV
jgi:hypothetical protein